MVLASVLPRSVHSLALLTAVSIPLSIFFLEVAMSFSSNTLARSREQGESKSYRRRSLFAGLFGRVSSTGIGISAGGAPGSGPMFRGSSKPGSVGSMRTLCGRFCGSCGRNGPEGCWRFGLDIELSFAACSVVIVQASCRQHPSGLVYDAISACLLHINSIPSNYSREV
jgi:hypothetical protein